MADAQQATKEIVVTGDVTFDWNLARTRGSPADGAGWSTDDCTRACQQRGGAALLADLIQAVADDLRSTGGQACNLRQTGAPREPVRADDGRFHHSYAMWSTYRQGEKPAWRVAEFLGFDSCRSGEPEQGADWRRVVDDVPDPDLVVLDDAGLGFRDRPGLWPLALSNPESRPWLILKMARPVANGPLWDELSRNRPDRLLALMSLNDLRRTEVQVSRGLSWERTAQDLAWELTYNPRVNALSRCAATVISLGPVGAFLLSHLDPSGRPLPAEAKPGCYLFFDPQLIEGEWEQRCAGGMIGYNTCLAAAIVRQLLLSPAQPDLARAIQSGVAAMRRLHLEGYADREGNEPSGSLRFPIARVAAALAADGAPLALAEVQDPVRYLLAEPPLPLGEGWGEGPLHGPPTDHTPGEGSSPEAGFWTILQDRYVGDLAGVARRVALEGAEAVLHDVPQGRFGALLTVDRREIEGLRSISALVNEYCCQPKPKRPLSIAVFGPPGAGKSFGITQVAKSLLPDQIRVLEFNLSQLRSPEELAGALHQVRDASLGGNIPLVFWDEFDTTLAEKPLGWLRYFLAPMQDGAFHEGQLSHPIGRAIFVFAGGTSPCLEEFGRNVSPADFRLAKGTDFVSRLKGYVNVLGPNRQFGDGAGRRTHDPHFIIRRAILLRSILKRDAPRLFRKEGGREVLSIDSGVLRAFLEVGEYRHGARSIEAIVAMSLLWGKTTFERSCLPSEMQLDLHVDGREFLALVQRLDLEGELLERLAAAHHEVFCDDLIAQGKFTHSSFKPYAELPEDEKEQNRGAVRDIPSKLAHAGYVMAPARSDEPPLEFPGDELERLAEMEHNRWTKAKLADGWRYAPVTDKARRLHSCLTPWRQAPRAELERVFSPAELEAMGTEELPPAEKKKDYDLVRGIPRILAKAGYAVVRLRRQTRRPAVTSESLGVTSPWQP